MMTQNTEVFEALFLYASEGILIANKNGEIILINPSAEKMFGYQKNEMLGKKVEVLIPERLAHQHTSYRETYNNNPQPRAMGVKKNLFGKRKDGSEFSVEISLSPYKKNEELFIIAFIIDITIRKKNEEEIIKKNEELTILSTHLKESYHELEQFIKITSHDLQEPMRLIVSYLQLLEKKYKDKLDTDANDYINFAVESGNAMRKLILSLVDYSAIGKVISFEELNLNELLNDVLKELSIQIKETNAVVTAIPLPVIYGDKVLIHKLFENLITNAIKFKSEKNPEILISGNKVENDFSFSVKDNGLGIKAEYTDKIFTMFQHLNAGVQFSGSGIGLVMCKKIVERHGGKIWFESEFGKGTTFYFTIKEKSMEKNSLS